MRVLDLVYRGKYPSSTFVRHWHGEDINKSLWREGSCGMNGGETGVRFSIIGLATASHCKEPTSTISGSFRKKRKPTPLATCTLVATDLSLNLHRTPWIDTCYHLWADAWHSKALVANFRLPADCWSLMFLPFPIAPLCLPHQIAKPKHQPD